MTDKKEDFAELTRREFLYLSGMGMAGMTLGGIPELGHGAEKKPKYGGRLRVGERSASAGLDAHKNQFFMDLFNYTLMYNALTIMGPLPQVRMYPDLAKSWEISPDGREYTFPLREGVKFHHGKELDSGDVKYSIERVMNPATRSPRAFAYRWIDSVNAIDKYHVKIRLKEPFGPFLTTLTTQNCPIIPAGWEPTGTKPAPGTGPFILKSFVPNEITEFTRFDQYWEVDEKTGNRLPYLDSIYVKKIVDPTVRWTGLRGGDLDYTVDTPRTMFLEAMKNPVPGIVVVAPQPVGNTWIWFNVSKPPFADKKVRQAVAYAIDKNELIRASLWGLGESVNNQPFLNRSRMYIPVKDREVDLAKAKQLLAEAGYPDGLKTEFFEPSGFISDLDGCQVAIGQLKKIGIDATMKVIDRVAWMKNMREGEYFIALRGDTERLDPDDAYYLNFHSGEIGKNNWSRYSNKELDELLEKGRTTWKWEDRVPIYRKVVEIIKEDLPILYLAKTIIPVVYRDYVKGFEAGAATWFGYYGGGMKKTWLDK
jgi:peptide/nickel transport system substrate-binding protein